MGLDSTGTPKANGLKTALDTIIAPKEAFEQLRVAPTWGWAFVLSLALYAIGSYLCTAAVLHGMAADWPHQVAANPRLAGMTAEQQQSALALTLKIGQFAWIFSIVLTPLILLVQTVIMLLFKVIGKGDASFRSLWAAACNIAVPALGINGLVTAAIVIVRGPDSFGSAAEVQTALPSLALLVPNSAIKLHAFLSLINPFTLWSLGLMVVAMTVVARVPRVWAWTTAIVILLLSASLVTLGAQ